MSAGKGKDNQWRDNCCGYMCRCAMVTTPTSLEDLPLSTKLPAGNRLIEIGRGDGPWAYLPESLDRPCQSFIGGSESSERIGM